ncbi:tyrosinase family oxidase copper chaperone [Actinoplanes utahensis]|uniref:Tyrosinase co-factor MelC1 n=1 Tax=Actinoplanes utahensis TaxID=1869 RepID=A0A0A6UEK9_ACTUT|nr:tyrosinase family oxidase copper chaperone [Actinoplanes utahensis]KHD74470.1 hypothetical protein MB27_28530 [Actinoplanes utahensis]
MNAKPWRRAVTLLVVAAGSLSGAAAAGPPEPDFAETYRGHRITGWGSGERACAYIDGRRLVVFPQPDGGYTSAVQGFQPAPDLLAITRASVTALGDLGLATTAEPSAHCPQTVAARP